MNYARHTVSELKAICKERHISGISGKKKNELIAMLAPAPEPEPEPEPCVDIRQDIIHGDTLDILPTLKADSAQIIIADPPYNIGKDFGNDSDKQPIDTYLLWCLLLL